MYVLCYISKRKAQKETKLMEHLTWTNLLDLYRDVLVQPYIYKNIYPEKRVLMNLHCVSSIDLKILQNLKVINSLGTVQ